MGRGNDIIISKIKNFLKSVGPGRLIGSQQKATYPGVYGQPKVNVMG